MSKGIEILQEEYKEIKKSNKLTSIGGTANPKNWNLFFWEACLKGPKNSPYENGFFILQMKFNENYPYERPLVQMRTPIFHPNINNENGNICVEYLNRWEKDYNIIGIMYAVFELLYFPNFANAYSFYKCKDERTYFKIASKYTFNYADETQMCLLHLWDKGWKFEGFLDDIQ